MLKIITRIIIPIVFLSSLFGRQVGYAQEAFIYDKDEFARDLVYEHIEKIFTDRDGFIWLATTTGLYMYDGYAFKTYIHNSREKTSISENFITELFEDSRGLIWIGTYNNGLNIFDKKTNSFTSLISIPGDSSSISSNKIHRPDYLIIEDNEGNIWVNTDNGLNKIDPETKKVERHKGDLLGQIIYHKNRDEIWIGGRNLMRYNPKDKTVENFEIPNVSDPVNAILLSHEGDIWIGTDSGLFIFNITEKVFYPIESFYSKRSDEYFNWSLNSISTLYEDINGNIWIGSGKSVYILNASDGSYDGIKYEEGLDYGLFNEEIKGIYGNKYGTVFITYTSRDITKINISVNNFKRIPTVIDPQIKANEIMVRSILKDKFDNMWVGTYNYGVSRISGKDERDIVTFSHDPDNPQTLNSTYISALYIDSGDRLWVGTFEDGYNYADDIFKSKRLKFHSSPFEEKVEIHEFTEDATGKIWISTNIGFYIYDKKIEKIVHYGDQVNQDPTLKSLNIQSVTQELKNVFWLATWNNGIAKLTINSDTLLSPAIGQDELIIYNEVIDENGYSLDNRFINLYQDKDQKIWLASNINGLVKMTIEKDEPTFINYDESKGAPSNSVFAIAEDDQGFLWISSLNGIGKFDPETEQFINYHESDGIQSNTFIWDSYYQSATGEIYFGGHNGITAFFPDSIEDSDSERDAYLSKLIVNHKEVNIGDVLNDRVVLDKEIRFAEELTLTHKESIISLEFGALNVSNPQKAIFAYKLEGFDEDWIYTSSDNRIATYTNLKNETYVFKVKATKNQGYWNSKPVELIITVLPPWWNTWWAYLAYIFIFLFLLYLFQQELDNRSELRHKLSLERYKHERDNELNQEKFRFFTNLSHELRTPLTLILGPLDRMINKNEVNNRVKQNLKLIHKQATRLQKLTNQLLNFRKYEIDNLKLKAAEGDLVDFLKEISVAFRQHARMKKVHFNYLPVQEEARIYFDRDKLEIIIVNLLSNAFKFTAQDGTVELKLSQSTSDNVNKIVQKRILSKSSFFGELPEASKKVIQLEVTDSGIGISSDQLLHIFERYFQASNVQTISVGGTGIGLEIAKNYVELHHGTIMVESEIDKGTKFYIWLPMGRAHLSEAEILHDFKPSEHQDHYTSPGKDLQQKYKDIPLTEEIGVLSPNKQSVLVVDDNPDILFFLKESFEKDFNVLLAQNGKVGLDIARKHMPDIIISDIMMPEIDGLELCRLIKSDIRTSHIPLILLTARTSNIFQAEGFETGADDYITKPFDERILNIRVKNLIESRKQLRSRYSKEVMLMPKDITITQPDEHFLDRVIEIIEDNISNSNLKVEWLAKEIGMSHSVFYKKVLALTDLTVVEFIRTIRLKKAALILNNPNISISQIAHEVGFSDPKYFSKCFQKFYGIIPSEYKNKISA